MIIYLDIIFIENVCMNFIILYTVGYILRIKPQYIKLIISSIFGSIYTILAYMKIIEMQSNFFIKMILSVVMVYIAYYPKSIKKLVKELLFFYLISFLFGGVILALLFFIKPDEIIFKNGILVGTYPLKIILLGSIVGFIIISIVFYLIKRKKYVKNYFCNMMIYLDNKSIKVRTLIDTGNLLKDPMSNMPVVIVEKEKLKELLDDKLLNEIIKIENENLEKLYNFNFANKIRVIPFKSIGKSNGLLIGIKIDKILIEMEEKEYEIKDVIVGIYNNSFNCKERYSALMGLNVLEGGLENEFTTNVSWKY